MRTAVVVSASSVVVVLLLAWITWAFLLRPVDRVFLSMLFGLGSMAGQ